MITIKAPVITPTGARARLRATIVEERNNTVERKYSIMKSMRNMKDI